MVKAKQVKVRLYFTAKRFQFNDLIERSDENQCRKKKKKVMAISSEMCNYFSVCENRLSVKA